MDSFDFVIIGAGPAGESAAFEARHRGASVAIVDRRWFGGSCPFIGCVPSKSILDSAARHHANPARWSWRDASDRRDWMVNRPAGIAEPDDASHVKALEQAGAVAYRGAAQIIERGVVEVRHDGAVHRITGREVMVAVGSTSRVPPIPGLDAVPFWTNREATLARELPKSLLVLGGGPTGCELAQGFARFGVPVTIVQSGDRLTPTDHPRNSAVITEALREDGVHGPARLPRGESARRRRDGRRARHRPVRRLERRGPRDPARGRARLPARRARARGLRRRHERTHAVPARRPPANRRRPVGHRRPGRAGAAHAPGALPGRGRGADGPRRRRPARLPGAARARRTPTRRPRSSA